MISVTISDTTKQDTREMIFDEVLAKCHRYLARDGFDLIWSYDPKPTFKNDLLLPFGLILIPLLICGLTMLVYVVVMRCRFLFSGSLPPNTSPSPPETSETTPR